MTIYNTQQQYKPVYKHKLRALRGSSQPLQIYKKSIDLPVPTVMTV